MPLEGLLPEEAIHSRLAQARRTGGPDAAGFVQLTEIMQELAVLRQADLDATAGLQLLGRVVHALAAAPFVLAADPSHVLKLTRFCGPFMVVHSNGMTTMPAELQVPETPIAEYLWPRTTSAAVALRAVVAAFALMVSSGLQTGTAAPRKLCARLVAELSRAPTASAIQAELEAVQSAASASDLLYLAHFVLGSCSAAELFAACPGFHPDKSASSPLNQAGRLAGDRWKRATAGMTEALPQQPHGYEQCVQACTRTGAWGEAVQWAERGVHVADAAGNSYHAAKLRHLLGGSLIVQANRTGTRIRAGRLRQLVAEARELQARVKPWLPSHFYKDIPSVTLKAFLDSIAGARDDDMVAPQRSGEPARLRSYKQCADCGVALMDPKLCAACKNVAYCSRECQKRHWKEGGHKAECAALASRRGRGG